MLVGRTSVDYRDQGDPISPCRDDSEDPPPKILLWLRFAPPSSMTRQGLLLLGLAAAADAFYLPGVAPHEYADGDKVEIKVNKLSSTKTQVGPTLALSKAHTAEASEGMEAGHAAA